MNTQNGNTDDDLTISYQKPLEACPEGRHAMICVDVFNTHPEEMTFDGKTKLYDKVMFVFQIFPDDESRDSEGNVFLVERKFTRSLDPRAQLRLALEKWRGRDFTDAELEGFSLLKLKGVAAWGTIIHNTRFVNIQDLEPFVDDDGKPLAFPKPEKYRRRKYPKKTAGSGSSQQTSQPTPATAQTGTGDADDPYVPF